MKKSVKKSKKKVKTDKVIHIDESEIVRLDKLRQEFYLYILSSDQVLVKVGFDEFIPLENSSTNHIEIN